MTALARANTSAEEQALRERGVAWGLARWPDARMIHELALGDRRIDMVFVRPTDIIGMEVKGPRDRLGDGRLVAQWREFHYWLPECWLLIDERWASHAEVRHLMAANRLVAPAAPAALVAEPSGLRGDASRDDLCCSRLLDLLWQPEAAAIAQRQHVTPGPVLSRQPKSRITAMLARLLTGHELVKEVCRELRARALVGAGSAQPMRTEHP